MAARPASLGSSAQHRRYIVNPKDMPQAKKPYSSPVVRDYGNIRDITRATGTTSMNADGGMGINNKT